MNPKKTIITWKLQIEVILHGQLERFSFVFLVGEEKVSESEA